MPFHADLKKYPVPCVNLIITNDHGEILLLKRNVEPFKNGWELPGGRIEVSDNNSEAAAQREVREETGFEITITHLIDVVANEQSCDPRFYPVQVLYLATIVSGQFQQSAEARESKWIDPVVAINEQLNFNHNQLIKIYLEKLNNNKLIPAKRRVFSDFFDKPISYFQNTRPCFAVKNLILNENNKILLARRAIPPCFGAWDLPGGHIFAGENIATCAQREIHEELGVNGQLGDLFQVYSDKGKGPKHACVVAYYFSTINSQDFQKNIEISDFRYFPLNNLPSEIAYHNEGVLEDVREYVENVKIRISNDK